MGIMTLADFRDDVTTGLQRGTDPTVHQPRLDRWINNSMFEFGYALRFPELEGYEEQQLLIGETTLVLPTDFRAMHENGMQVLGIENFEGSILPETRKQFIRRNRTVGALVTPGRPKRYHRYGMSLTIRPAADVDYTVVLHYWKKITRLQAAIEASIFGEDWDDIIMTGALYRGFRHFNEFDRYQNVRNDFLGLIRSRKMAEDLEEFPEGGISVVDYKSREEDDTYGTPDSELFGEIP